MRDGLGRSFQHRNDQPVCMMRYNHFILPPTVESLQTLSTCLPISLNLYLGGQYASSFLTLLVGIYLQGTYRGGRWNPQPLPSTLLVTANSPFLPFRPSSELQEQNPQIISCIWTREGPGSEHMRQKGVRVSESLAVNPFASA